MLKLRMREEMMVVELREYLTKYKENREARFTGLINTRAWTVA